MKNIFVKLNFILFFTLYIGVAQSQNLSSALAEGIRFQTGENSVVKFRFGTQVWLRYMQVNPQTTGVSGEVADNLFDMGLRRNRFICSGSFLQDKIVAYTQFGMNGQNFVIRNKPQLYIHDIWLAYRPFGKEVYIGAGLHGWTGTLRAHNASSTSHILYDHLKFAFPDIGKTDQSGRQPGVFLKGNISKINYRIAANKPFLCDERNKIGIEKSSYYPNTQWAFKGYFVYSFLDEEVSKSAFMPFSYLGKKKLFNIGMGADYHKGAMASLSTSGDTVRHDKLHLGVDVFLDYPFENQSVLTFYAAFGRYDFGIGHLRSASAMNPLKKGGLKQGGGNSFFTRGTGNTYLGILAYILPENWQFIPGGRLQPVVSLTCQQFKDIDPLVMQWDAGLNYYVSGHKLKLGLHYVTHQIHKDTEKGMPIDGIRSSIILQTQIFL